MSKGKEKKQQELGQCAGAIRTLSEKQPKRSRNGRDKHQIRVHAMFSNLSKIRIHSDITVELTSS